MAAVARSRDWRHARTHRETRTETTRLELPPGLQSILQTLADEIDALNAENKATRAEIASLKSALLEAAAHLTEAA